MSNLPSKPEFSRTASARREPSDERRPSGPGRSSPDRYAYSRDDRDRDRDLRDRDRGHRSRYASSGQRSPPPSRSSDTYIGGSRDSYHGRDYRGYEDTRARDDRRRDWDRERDWDRDRDRDRERRYHRRDDVWPPRNDYSPNRPEVSRRSYNPRDSDWRGRDDYRRERDWERGRSRDRDRDRDDQWPRDRDHDRRHASPLYHPAPLSPRRDRYHDSRSPPRRAPRYPSRGRRSISPRSTGNRSRRSSPLSRARPEPADTHPPRDIPRAPRSPSPCRASPSPRRYPRSMPSPTRSDHEPQPAERTGCYPDESQSDDVPGPVKVKDEPVDGAVVVDGQMDLAMTTEPAIRKDRSDHQDGEMHGKAAPRSPVECQQQSPPSSETVAGPSKEMAVTQPYLPAIPRYGAKPKFSAAYESEYDRLEAHRAHAAAECRRCSKASRRAFHELEMTTLDLRAAQLRRELAESHRKKAHHGQLGIDAESAVNK